MQSAAQSDAAAGRFPEMIQVRAPRGLRGAIKVAAGRRHSSAAEWSRQTLLRALEAEGVRLSASCEGGR